MCYFFSFFFFSSRRRHTRWPRDWSSDVCSSDLAVEDGAVIALRPVYAGKALLKVKVAGSPAVLSLRPNVFTPVRRPKIGRASCRERVEISVVDVSLKKEKSRVAGAR